MEKGIQFDAVCPICGEMKSFSGPDNYYTWRDQLISGDCASTPWKCVVRERALAKALFSIFSKKRVVTKQIHESSPMIRGLSKWLAENCQGYTPTGFFPDAERGVVVGGYRNEDLEAQTFEDHVFDIVLHSDVLEHLFNPFTALQEIWRTLKPGGYCLFAVPTYPGRIRSEQVAFLENGKLRIDGEPEYHGNPQSGEGSLVTWRYGYDLPQLIAEHTEFDVEVRRWQARRSAILGPMTEIYILSK